MKMEYAVLCGRRGDVLTEFQGTGEPMTLEERRKTPDPEGWYDSQFTAVPTPVEPGTFACTAEPDTMFVARIGSGIGICVYDPGIGVGAMAHVLLSPDLIRQFPRISSSNGRILAESEALIDQMIGALKHHGAGRSRIKVRICGGTSIHEEILDNGLKNYILAKDMLMRRGLKVAGEDIAGGLCRRVQFFPTTGRLIRQPLRRKDDIDRIRTEEAVYLDGLTKLL